jgi:hypothetical protein
LKHSSGGFEIRKAQKYYKTGQGQKSITAKLGMGNFSKRLIQTSLVMPFSEAQGIALKFADNLVELGEFRRKQVLQKRRGQPVLWSLPINHLKHSKWQIQIALAITVAEYVARLIIEPSDEARDIQGAAMNGCAELAWFTRQSVYFPPQKNDRHFDSLEVLSVCRWWRDLCEKCVKTCLKVELTDDAISEQVLTQYWDDVDYNISALLNQSLFRAIRQT